MLDNAIIYASDFNDAFFLKQSLASLRFFDKETHILVLTDSIGANSAYAHMFEKNGIEVVDAS